MTGLFDSPKLQREINKHAPNFKEEYLPLVAKDKQEDAIARTRVGNEYSAGGIKCAAIMPHAKLYIAITKKLNSLQDVNRYISRLDGVSVGVYGDRGLLVPRQRDKYCGGE